MLKKLIALVFIGWSGLANAGFDVVALGVQGVFFYVVQSIGMDRERS